jgi:hypothetical protein
MTQLNISLPPPKDSPDFDGWMVQVSQYLRDYLGISVTTYSQPGTYTISSDTTISEDINISPGVLFAIGNGVTLTFSKAFDAGLYQVFVCTGTGKVVFGPGSVKEVFPEWWAPNTSPGTTDMTSAIQAAANAAPIVKLQKTSYEASHIDLNTGNQIIGSGWGTILHAITGTTIRTESDGLLCVNRNNAATLVENVVIKDMQLRMDVLTGAHSGGDEFNHLIITGIATDVLIENIYFNGWKGDAVCIGAQGLTPRIPSVTQDIVIRKCKFDGLTNKTRQAVSILSAIGVVIDGNRISNTTAAAQPGAICIEPELATAYLFNITISNNNFDNIGPVGTLKPPFIIDLGNVDATYPERRGRISFEKNTVLAASMITIKSVGVTNSALKSQDINISNNVFRNVTGAGTIGPVNGLTIEKNAFFDCGNFAIGNGTYKATAVKVIDNVFDICGTPGAVISSSYCEDMEISGNSFIDCGAEAGVGVNVIYTSTGTISSLRIRNNVFSTPNAITTRSVYNNGGTITTSVFEDNVLLDSIATNYGW